MGIGCAFGRGGLANFGTWTATPAERAGPVRTKMAPMNAMNPIVLVTTEGFSNRLELVDYAEERAAKLLRHARPRVDAVRVHVRRETPRSAGERFVARAICSHAGLDHIAHAGAPEPDTAIHDVLAKLERALASDGRALRRRERHAEVINLAEYAI